MISHQKILKFVIGLLLGAQIVNMNSATDLTHWSEVI